MIKNKLKFLRLTKSLCSINIIYIYTCFIILICLILYFIGYDFITNLISAGSACFKLEVKLAKASQPTDVFINSFLEHLDNLSPLEELILIQTQLNILLFIKLIFLIVILFFSGFKNSGAYFLENYLPDSFRPYFTKFVIFSDKYYLFLFIFVFSLIILNFIFSFFISSQLILNLDDYIVVHNQVHNIKIK